MGALSASRAGGCRQSSTSASLALLWHIHFTVDMVRCHGAPKVPPTAHGLNNHESPQTPCIHITSPGWPFISGGHQCAGTCWCAVPIISDWLKAGVTAAGDAEALLADCPPGRRADEKMVLGVFDDGDPPGRSPGCRSGLSASGYVVHRSAALDPARRGGAGLGRRVYQAFERWAAAASASRHRAGCCEGQLWRGPILGAARSAPSGKPAAAPFGHREHVVDVWRREHPAPRFGRRPTRLTCEWSFGIRLAKTPRTRSI